MGQDKEDVTEKTELESESQDKLAVEETESLDALDALPPREAFGDLDKWVGEEKADLAVGDSVTISPGNAGDETNRPKQYGKRAIIIFVCLCVIACVAGFFERNQLPTFLLKRAPWHHALEIELIESRDDRVLMLETSGEASRVIVEVSGQASWLLVSQGDTTATNPALSPDGEQVAYVTERDGEQLVIVSLTSNTRRTVRAGQIQDADGDDGLDGMRLCPWTPIAWAPTGDRIAFFGCAEDDSLSVVLVGELSGPAISLTVVARSKVESSATRQLSWLDDTQLVVSTPADDTQQAAIITLAVP